MSTVPANVNYGWLEVTMIWRARNGQTHTCKMFYSAPSAHTPTVASLQTSCDNWHAAFGGEVDDIMDHEDAYAVTKFKWREGGGGLVEVEVHKADTISGDLGDIAEDATAELDALPPYAALQIVKNTGYKGRANRGRLFIPCISEMVQHDGLIDVLNVTACKQIADHLLTPVPIDEVAYDPAHWNRKTNESVMVVRMYPMNQLVTRRDRRLDIGDRLPL